jgi:hypothetical protein
VFAFRMLQQIALKIEREKTLEFEVEERKSRN